MSRLDHIEDSFFTDGPQSLRHAALAFAFIGFAGGMAIVLNVEGGFDARHLWFAGIGLIPGALCWLLSIAVRARHIATIPLTALLCALSIYLFWGNPSNAAAGMTPYVPMLIGIWAVVILEYVLVLCTMLFMFVLWRKGTFSTPA